RSRLFAHSPVAKKTVPRTVFSRPSIPSIFIIQKKKTPQGRFFLLEQATGISVRFQGLPLCSARSRLFAHSPVAKKTVPRTVFSRPSIPSIFIIQKKKTPQGRFFLLE
ncbi:MAG: hypothetical protein J6R45_06500, partial [Clostridia bacterium]|nr:hypothetical protein [Clostridia bacterium]